MASKKLTSDEVNALMEGLQNSDYSVSVDVALFREEIRINRSFEETCGGVEAKTYSFARCHNTLLDVMLAQRKLRASSSEKRCSGSV